MATIKEYYRLVKPGILYANLIPVIGGFALGTDAAEHFGLVLFAAVLAGIVFVIASGCVFNNYIDRDIDKAMERTKDRALATGRISGRAALVYATCLGVIGFLTLVLFTNLLTAGTAFVGFFFYVFMYSLWSKRRTTYGAIVGSVAGGVPPVVGYVAASGRLDMAALVLSSILILWQMPHFYAIAIRHAKEYEAAGVPVMPLVRGVRAAKARILLYVAAFTLVAPLLAVFGYEGSLYFAVAVLLGLSWLALCIKGFRAKDDARWARMMFSFSLVVMVALFIAIMIDVTPVALLLSRR